MEPLRVVRDANVDATAIVFEAIALAALLCVACLIYLVIIYESDALANKKK